MSEGEGIRAFQRLSPRITTSGRLTESDLDTLAGLDVAHVVNLALADHPDILPDEGARLAERGISYTHIPVPFNAPGEDHFARFVAALGDNPGPIHVHCVANWRVSAFFYRWHRDTCRMDEGEARTLMNQQWSPEHSDHPSALAWVAFIAGKREY